MTLTKTDKRVIEAFTEKKVDSNKRFDSNGEVLDGSWMGGRGLAHWDSNGKIFIRDAHGLSSQTVNRYIRKITPKFWLA